MVDTSSHLVGKSTKIENSENIDNLEALNGLVGFNPDLSFEAVFKNTLLNYLTKKYQVSRKEKLIEDIVSMKGAGKSFSEISEEIKKKYNIKRTRQSIYGLYKRHCGECGLYEKHRKIEEIYLVCRMYTLGQSMSKVYSALGSSGYELSYSDVIDIIKNNQPFLNKIRSCMDNWAEQCLKAGVRPSDILRSLSFMGVQMSSREFDEFLKKAVLRIIAE